MRQLATRLAGASRHRLAGGNRLPAGAALLDVGVIARRVLAVVPVLRGVAVIGVAVVIAPPATESAAASKVITIAAAMPKVVMIPAEMRAMKPAAMKPAKTASAECAAMEAAAKSAAMKAAAGVETSTPATAVETSASATAVETSASAAAVGTSASPAVGTTATAAASAMSVDGIWLAERGNAQQSKGGGCQSPSCAGASFLLV